MKTTNTFNDRYRGVFGMREVLFINEADIRKLGFEPGDKVDMVSLWEEDKPINNTEGFKQSPFFTTI
ncbi:hypothetical protein NDJ59_03250 [Vibrio parahaemolyticus]|uniref:hypothetical protein n=1 Tax=Vibrio parahaemolyticus TaxID=670 RepID=UPI002160874C|nr:hypothetical protein [Vibrio parahaemolyticus]MCS0099274.1 hypothetical protein [Vibrio parahaemolyticus]